MSLHYPHLLLFTLTLTLLLFSSQASRLALLQPQPHNFHRTDDKPFTPDAVPYQELVRQYEGNANTTILLEVVTMRRKERVRNTWVRPRSTAILSRWEVSEPWRDRKSRRWRMNLSAYFRGAVGTADFSVIVQTDNELYFYVADFRITVAGVSVLLGKRAVSGAYKQALGLGPYYAWLNVRQFALPVEAVGENGKFAQLPVGNGVSIALLGGRGSERDGVDSVVFDDDKCADGTGVDVVSEVKEEDVEGNTLFVRGEDRYSLGRANLPEECGLAFSKDGRWVLIRLEEYRVSSYAFAFEIQVSESNSAKLFPNTLTTHLVFDRDEIPPPVVYNSTVTVDAFGGEVLRYSLGNVLSPPQPRELIVTDFTLDLRTKDGAISKPVQAHWMRKLEQVGNDRRVREVRFRTPSCKKYAGMELQPFVNYTLVDVPKSELTPQYFLPNPFDERPKSSAAAVAPGNKISIRVAKATLAQADSCDLGNGDYEEDRFVIAELDVAHYTKANFSRHKKMQLTKEIQSYFPGVKEDGVKFVSVKKGVLTYAVSILKKEDDLTMRIDTLKQAIENHSFASAVLLGFKDVSERNISVVSQSLCTAFPALAAGSFELDGIEVRLLPLWIILGIGAILMLSVLALRFSKSVQMERSSSLTYILQTPNDLSELDYDPDETPEGASVVTSECFPTSSRSSSAARRARATPTEVGQDLVQPMYQRDSIRKHNITFDADSREAGMLDISGVESSTTNSIADKGFLGRMLGGVRSGFARAVETFKRDEIVTSETPQPEAHVEQIYIEASSDEKP